MKETIVWSVLFVLGLVMVLFRMDISRYLSDITALEYSWTVCALASAASLEELAIHLRQKCYCADVKGILQLARKSKMLRF